MSLQTRKKIGRLRRMRRAEFNDIILPPAFLGQSPRLRTKVPFDVQNDTTESLAHQRVNHRQDDRSRFARASAANNGD